jgi:oligoendopeptidase F
MSNTNALPKRSDLRPERTWDPTSIFPDDAAWEAAIADIKAQLPTAKQYEGQLNSGPAVLADYLAAATALMVQSMHVYLYASMYFNVDSNDQQAAARMGRSGALFAQVSAALAFADPEMMAIGFDTLREWVAKDIRLNAYEHYIDQLENQQAHTRSSEVEQVIALSAETRSAPGTIYNRLTNADMRFADAQDSDGNAHPVAQSTIGKLRTASDRTLRRTAEESYADGYLQFKNTLASAVEGRVKADVFNMRVRGYESCLAASLAPNKIPTAVFHNLIDVFERNLPTWHRYWRVRRQALGFEALGVHDIKAPLSAEKPYVPYETAVNWIADGMAPLGDAYVTTLRRGCLEERWVDVYPNQGKRQGAFSSGGPGTHPFIMMSYTDDLFSLSTLAHELGHSMHSYLTWQNQPVQYSRYSLFAAEVASNFNQALVRDHLFRTHPDANFQIALIEEAMSNFHRYFFIMPTLARFELAIHERGEQGQPLTADAMIGLMADLFGEGYGTELTYDRDRVGITWAQFSHLFQPFYVYQYATGISGAHALARRILDDEPGAVDDYLGFLRAGGSQYPLAALQAAGVDLTTPEPVEAAFAVLADLVERLESLTIAA